MHRDLQSSLEFIPANKYIYARFIVNNCNLSICNHILIRFLLVLLFLDHYNETAPF